MTMSLADWFSLTAPAMDAPAYFYITHKTFTIHSQQNHCVKRSAGADFMHVSAWVSIWAIRSIFDGFAAYYYAAQQ